MWTVGGGHKEVDTYSAIFMEKQGKMDHKLKQLCRDKTSDEFREWRIEREAATLPDSIQ